ncbi:MAG TPA: hypothetical protein VIK56_14165 [Rhodoferax sp.]
MKAGQWARKTSFEPLADGSVRRTVLGADGTVEKQEVLVGPQWQLMAARAQSGLSQSEFTRATGVSVRTLQPLCIYLVSTFMEYLFTIPLSSKRTIKVFRV